MLLTDELQTFDISARLHYRFTHVVFYMAILRAVCGVPPCFKAMENYVSIQFAIKIGRNLVK